MNSTSLRRCLVRFPVRNSPLQYGRASLEFLVAAVVLFVPTLTFALVTHSLSSAQLATEAAARHAARVFTQQTNLNLAVVKTRQAVSHTFRQYSLEATPTLQIRCRPTTSCLNPDSWVDIRVSANVPLLRVALPSFDRPPAITVRATASAQVSHYRGEP